METILTYIMSMIDITIYIITKELFSSVSGKFRRYEALKIGSLFIKMCDQTPYFHYCQHRICIHLLGSYYWKYHYHCPLHIQCPMSPKQIYFIYPHWKLCGRFNISSILCRQRLITIYFSVQKFPDLINHENMEVSNFYFISAKSFPHLTFL